MINVWGVAQVRGFDLDEFNEILSKSDISPVPAMNNCDNIMPDFVFHLKFLAGNHGISGGKEP